VPQHPPDAEVLELGIRLRGELALEAEKLRAAGYQSPDLPEMMRGRRRRQVKGLSDGEIDFYLARWAVGRHGPWVEGFRDVSKRFTRVSHATRDLGFEIDCSDAAAADWLPSGMWTWWPVPLHFYEQLDSAVRATAGCAWADDMKMILPAPHRKALDAGPGKTQVSLRSFATAARLLANLAEQLLARAPDPVKTAQQARRGNRLDGGALPKIDVYELVLWAKKQNVTPTRLAVRLAANKLPRDPGGPILTANGWLERIRGVRRRMRDASRKQGRNP
jgi:hypothetical protein